MTMEKSSGGNGNDGEDRKPNKRGHEDAFGKPAEKREPKKIGFNNDTVRRPLFSETPMTAAKLTQWLDQENNRCVQQKLRKWNITAEQIEQLPENTMIGFGPVNSKGIRELHRTAPASPPSDPEEKEEKNQDHDRTPPPSPGKGK